MSVINPINTTFSATDISTAAQIYEYDAASTCKIFFQVRLANVVGGGDYAIYLTKNMGGALEDDRVWPQTSATLPSGSQTPILATTEVDVNARDVIKLWARGQSGDTAVSGNILMFSDDSVPANVLNDIHSATFLASGTVTHVWVDPSDENGQLNISSTISGFSENTFRGSIIFTSGSLAGYGVGIGGYIGDGSNAEYGEVTGWFVFPGDTMQPSVGDTFIVVPIQTNTLSLVNIENDLFRATAVNQLNNGQITQVLDNGHYYTSITGMAQDYYNGAIYLIDKYGYPTGQGRAIKQFIGGDNGEIITEPFAVPPSVNDNFVIAAINPGVDFADAFNGVASNISDGFAGMQEVIQWLVSAYLVINGQIVTANSVSDFYVTMNDLNGNPLTGLADGYIQSGVMIFQGNAADMPGQWRSIVHFIGGDNGEIITEPFALIPNAGDKFFIIAAPYAAKPGDTMALPSDYDAAKSALSSDAFGTFADNFQVIFQQFGELLMYPAGFAVTNVISNSDFYTNQPDMLEDFLQGSVMFTSGACAWQTRAITKFIGGDNGEIQTEPFVGTVAVRDNLLILHASGSGGGSLDATGVRAALGMGSANLDMQLTGLDSDVLTRMPASGGATQINIIGFVTPGGNLRIINGDDYYAVDGRELDWSNAGWPDLTGATITFNYPHGAPIAMVGLVTGAGMQTVRLELSKTQTTAMPPEFNFTIRAILANGHEITIVKANRIIG